MVRQMFFNTAVTAVAFFISGLIGLLLVPILIDAFGLASFGLIMLARMLMPTAGMGLLDFGISEIATQAVSTGRAHDDWDTASSRMRVLGIATTLLGLLLSTLLYPSANLFATLMNVDVKHLDSFINVVQGTAVALPLLFLALMFEGVLKGYERFPLLRSIEVVTVLVYATITMVGIYSGWGYESAAWAFLLAQSGKAVVIIGFAVSSLPRSIAAQQSPDARSYVLERGRLLFFSRIQGTLQHQFPPLLIGALVGPVGVGIYDALLRLPRFAKSVLAILGTTLLPAASRLDASGDHRRLRHLGEFAVSILPAFILPPLAVIALFSSDLLTVWLGKDFTPHAAWLAIYWLVPAMNTIVSFQNSVLLSRPDYLRANNRIALTQTVLQLGCSVVLASSLDQFGFILGQVIATVLVFAYQIRLGKRQLDLPKQRIREFASYIIILMITIASLYPLLPHPTFPGFWSLLVGTGLLTSIVWLLSAIVFLKNEDRDKIRRLTGFLSRRHLG